MKEEVEQQGEDEEEKERKEKGRKEGAGSGKGEILIELDCVMFTVPSSQFLLSNVSSFHFDS